MSNNSVNWQSHAEYMTAHYNDQTPHVLHGPSLTEWGKHGCGSIYLVSHNPELALLSVWTLLQHIVDERKELLHDCILAHVIIARLDLHLAPHGHGQTYGFLQRSVSISPAVAAHQHCNLLCLECTSVHLGYQQSAVGPQSQTEHAAVSCQVWCMLYTVPCNATDTKQYSLLNH